MKIMHRALALVLSAVMVLTFMPALAFADDATTERGEPTSVKLTPVGNYTATGYYSSDGYEDEETGEWISTSDEYLYFPTPDLSEGDQLKVTYNTFDAAGNAGAPVEVVYEGVYVKEGDVGEIKFVATDDKSDVIEPWTEWVNEQSSEKQFTPGADEEFKVVVYQDDENQVFDTASAHLYLNNEGESLPWTLDDYDEIQYMENNKATLKVSPVFEGSGTAAFSYQWFEDEYVEDEAGDVMHPRHDPISGETKATYIATKPGDYSCEVTLIVDNAYIYEDSVDFTVYSWKITNEQPAINVEYGKPATLKIETTYKGSGMTYQWAIFDGTEEKYIPIEGATEASYTIPEVTKEYENYRCAITADGQTQYSFTEVYLNTDGYEWITTYPDAVASFTAHDGRDLEIAFEGGGIKKLFKQGDKITINNGSVTEEYVYISEDAEEDEDYEQYFINAADEEDRLECYVDYDTLDANAKTVHVYAHTDTVTDHEKKQVIRKYDTVIDLNASISTDVESIGFEPATISLYSEDIKYTYNGHTYYSIEGRDQKAFKEDENGTFVKGDKLTVKYTDGETKVFVYDGYEFVYNFIEDGEELASFAYPAFDRNDLDAGNNTLKLFYKGRYATVKVFVDTPQSRAARAAEKAADAEWNGVLNTKIPAAKKVKVKAASKKATVSWTKANSKNLKKFNKIEIQISNNKQFDRKNPLTKRFTISKSKKNYTIKKLKKGTYYIRVRHVKGTGAGKQVSKWSAAKKVKIKK